MVGAMTPDELVSLYKDEDEVRLFLVFSGTVQGVGFRWTTQELARQAGVSGWVRNMDDGTVEAELQGSGACVCSVIAGLQKQYLSANQGKYAFLRFLNLHFEITRCERRIPHFLDAQAQFKVLE